MSQVSKRLLDKNLKDYIVKNFVHTIADLNSPQDINRFLFDLLSPVEKTILTKRLAIALMLSRGYTYEQIDHILKVSRPTIKNVSHALKYGENKGFQNAVDKIVENQKKGEFFDKIEELLLQYPSRKTYKNAPRGNNKGSVKKPFFRRLFGK